MVLVLKLGLGYAGRRRADDFVSTYFPMGGQRRVEGGVGFGGGAGLGREQGREGGNPRPSAAGGMLGTEAGAGPGADASSWTKSKVILRGVEVTGEREKPKPGEGHVIFSGDDVAGEVPEAYGRVLERGARWAGVSVESVGFEVGRYERRLMGKSSTSR